jgi:nitrile hydratase
LKSEEATGFTVQQASQYFCQHAPVAKKRGVSENSQVRHMVERLISDIGGLPAGEIPREEKPLFWEKQMLATFRLLQQRGLVTRDEDRRTLEEIPPEQYKASTHYPLRLEGMIRLLIEKRVITAAELAARTQEIMARGTRDHV